MVFHHPNSKYWRDKADELWSDCIKIRAGFRCELTYKHGGRRAKDGLHVKGLHAHHLIERSQLGYRYDLDNGICLTVAVHGSHPNFRAHNFNAHGTEQERVRFAEVVEKMCPAKFIQWQINKKIKKRMTPLTYQEHYEVLLEQKEKLLKQYEEIFNN